MEIVTIHDAKTRLSALIKAVVNGKKVIISRNKEPLVELVPIQKKQRIPGLYRDAIIELSNEDDFNIDFDNSKLFPDEENSN